MKKHDHTCDDACSSSDEHIRAMNLDADEQIEESELEDRVARLEKQIDVLTRALHLSGVAVAPALKWLDVSMANTVSDGEDYPGKPDTYSWHQTRRDQRDDG